MNTMPPIPPIRIPPPKPMPCVVVSSQLSAVGEVTLYLRMLNRADPVGNPITVMCKAEIDLAKQHQPRAGQPATLHDGRLSYDDELLRFLGRPWSVPLPELAYSG